MAAILVHISIVHRTKKHWVLDDGSPFLGALAHLAVGKSLFVECAVLQWHLDVVRSNGVSGWNAQSRDGGCAFQKTRRHCLLEMVSETANLKCTPRIPILLDLTGDLQGAQVAI